MASPFALRAEGRSTARASHPLRPQRQRRGKRRRWRWHARRATPAASHRDRLLRLATPIALAELRAGTRAGLTAARRRAVDFLCAKEGPACQLERKAVSELDGHATLRCVCRRILSRTQCFRSDVSAVWPTNGAPCHKEAFELTLVCKWPKDFAVEPTREIDDLFNAVRKPNAKLISTNIFGADHANQLFCHLYSNGAMLSKGCNFWRVSNLLRVPSGAGVPTRG
jgi:hypothetical protein